MSTQITGSGITTPTIDLTTPLAVVDGGTGASTDPYRMGVMTAVVAAGQTSIDFTGIPSWAKRITVMLSGVSTSGASVPLIQLGTSGGVEITSYACVATVLTTSVSAAAYTTGFGFTTATGTNASSVQNGVIYLSHMGSNVWCCSGVLANTFNTYGGTTAGNKTLSASLDRVRITTVNGTDTFDAGSINVMYEG